MLGSLNAAYNKSMDISFSTSSGDDVTFSVSVVESAKITRDNHATTLEWMRDIRSALSIRGDGLSEADLDEIDAMMESIRPSIDTFFAEDKGNDAQETIRMIKEAIPPLLPSNAADTLKSNLLDYGISKLSNPTRNLRNDTDAIRTFYEELMRKLTENRPLDLKV